MELLKTINTGKSWVTCAKLLPFTQKLAVSSFSRSVKIYDLNTYEMVGEIQDIDYAPMAIDTW
jgi:WD40 repeat protein